MATMRPALGLICNIIWTYLALSDLSEGEWARGIRQSPKRLLSASLRSSSASSSDRLLAAQVLPELSQVLVTLVVHLNVDLGATLVVNGTNQLSSLCGVGQYKTTTILLCGSAPCCAQRRWIVCRSIGAQSSPSRGWRRHRCWAMRQTRALQRHGRSWWCRRRATNGACMKPRRGAWSQCRSLKHWSSIHARYCNRLMMDLPPFKIRTPPMWENKDKNCSLSKPWTYIHRQLDFQLLHEDSNLLNNLTILKITSLCWIGNPLKKSSNSTWKFFLVDHDPTAKRKNHLNRSELIMVLTVL